MLQLLCKYYIAKSLVHYQRQMILAITFCTKTLLGYLLYNWEYITKYIHLCVGKYPIQKLVKRVCMSLFFCLSFVVLQGYIQTFIKLLYFHKWCPYTDNNYQMIKELTKYFIFKITIKDASTRYIHWNIITMTTHSLFYFSK